MNLNMYFKLQFPNLNFEYFKNKQFDKIYEKYNVDKKILKAGHHHGSTFYQHLAFLRAIRNNAKADVSVNDGMVSVAIGEAAEKSIKEKRVVKINELF